ncbi:MAG: winged helix-turn-helix domain-containing protein, partial [Muribaculaceae bacterium]
TYKTLQIDIIKKKCIIDGEDIQLTKKEFEMLQLFLGTREKIFSREEILDRVWESDVLVIDRTIDVNINRLRKKIKNYGTNIITKLGYGYGFKE